MSGDITMLQVVEVLREVYDDDGVAIYLGATNLDFGGCRPIDLCKTPEGRFEVWQHAGSLAEGNYA